MIGSRSPGAIVKAGTVGVVTVFLLTFMGHHEGEKFVPYEDVAVPGLLTVCRGITNRAAPGWVIKDKRYTPAECDAKHAELIEKVFAPGVAKCTRVDITQRQWEMLMDFSWNEGIANTCGSTLMKRLNSGDCTGAVEAFDSWVYAGGRKWPGLINRRDAEQAEFVPWCKY
jgi:lysozyme